MAKQDNKAFFSDWLEKLQQESWQLELLISGLALFGIYESQDLLIELKMYASNDSEGFARKAQAFINLVLSAGWKIFFINLLIHVILRSLWIGAIGLRYVSHDIDYDALNYSDHFTKMLQKRVGGFDDFIERLEKICSVLFAYTFLLFLLFFSLFFFFFQILFLGDLINDMGGSSSSLIFVIGLVLYVIIGLIVFIDFISLGIFKKIEEKTVNKVYGYIFTFYGWTTLTFLYRPLLYNFLDNRYTKRLFFFSIPYILIILLASNMFTNNNFTFYPADTNDLKYGNTIDKMSYEDLRREYLTEVEPRVSKRRQNLPRVILNKYMNDEDYLRLFIKMHPSDYKIVQKNTDLEPYWKPGFKFTLFSSEKNEDSFYTERRKEKNVEVDSLRSIRRKIKRSKSKVQDSLKLKAIDVHMDSISTLIKDKRTTYNENAEVFEKAKQSKIVNAFLDLVELEINDSDIKNDLDCYFFQHYNNNEKGLMCVYPMDSLELGKNELFFYKEDQWRDENKRNVEITLPFYKVRSCD